jgi:hypothetical protein
MDMAVAMATAAAATATGVAVTVIAVVVMPVDADQLAAGALRQAAVMRPTVVDTAVGAKIRSAHSLNNFLRPFSRTWLRGLFSVLSFTAIRLFAGLGR